MLCSSLQAKMLSVIRADMYMQHPAVCEYKMTLNRFESQFVLLQAVKDEAK